MGVFRNGFFLWNINTPYSLCISNIWLSSHHIYHNISIIYHDIKYRIKYLWFAFRQVFGTGHPFLTTAYNRGLLFFFTGRIFMYIISYTWLLWFRRLISIQSPVPYIHAYHRKYSSPSDSILIDLLDWPFFIILCILRPRSQLVSTRSWWQTTSWKTDVFFSKFTAITFLLGYNPRGHCLGAPINFLSRHNEITSEPRFSPKVSVL